MSAATLERHPTTEKISGLIERVTFHNDESGFCVMRVKTPRHREETTVIGSLPSVTAGEWLVAEGRICIQSHDLSGVISAPHSV